PQPPARLISLSNLHAPSSNPLLSPEQASTMLELLRPSPSPPVLGGSTKSAHARAPGRRSRAEEREAQAAAVEV
ncbi:unnamed protein product, partial [Urochloa humidicola]